MYASILVVVHETRHIFPRLHIVPETIPPANSAGDCFTDTGLAHRYPSDFRALTNGSMHIDKYKRWVVDHFARIDGVITKLRSKMPAGKEIEKADLDVIRQKVPDRLEMVRTAHAATQRTYALSRPYGSSISRCFLERSRGHPDSNVS